jgi:cell division protein FtsB
MEKQSIEKLIEENKLLKEKINELKEHFKKYTEPYKNKKTDLEKIKEYNRRIYLIKMSST